MLLITLVIMTVCVCGVWLVNGDVSSVDIIGHKQCKQCGRLAVDRIGHTYWTFMTFHVVHVIFVFYPIFSNYF